MTATLLTKLLIEEVSGVDDPANQLPGWMLTKSRRQSRVQWERAVKACDDLRRELGDDEMFERVIQAFATEGEAIFLGRDHVRILRVVA